MESITEMKSNSNLKTITFKIMGSNTTNNINTIELPSSYEELLKLLKNINTSINYSENNIIFCIDGKPFDKINNTITYPTTSIKNNKYFIVVLVKPIKINQTHNSWNEGVRSTVEGYVTSECKTTFVPKNRLGEDTGVSLTIPEGTSLRDKNGNPIKITVQTVNGPSHINVSGRVFRNVTRD